jgi:nucleotide-binding universal stress UspA family protein
MWKKILVAIDGSAPSLHALKVAAGMAANNKAELTILSVVPPIPSMGLEGEMPQPPNYIDTIEESVKKMVASKVKEVEDSHPGLKVVPIVMTGSPSRKIVEAARAREVDLIVVGNRGTGGILNWMLGSVSRQVTDACTVPVLVVKDHKFCKP